MFNFLMGNFPQTDANIFQKVNECRKEEANRLLPYEPEGSKTKPDHLTALSTCLSESLFEKLDATCKLLSSEDPVTPKATQELLPINIHYNPPPNRPFITFDCLGLISNDKSYTKTERQAVCSTFSWGNFRRLMLISFKRSMTACVLIQIGRC